mgnify:CR=1
MYLALDDFSDFAVGVGVAFLDVAGVVLEAPRLQVLDVFIYLGITPSLIMRGQLKISKNFALRQ